ncbi:MAG: LysE family transporter [Paenacidovorax caeni]
MLGASASYAAVVWCMGQGAQWLVDGLPGLAPLAQWPCAAYLLWLAWQLARAPVEGRALQAAQAVPPWRAFAQGATVQALNPKAWLVALSGVGLFVLPLRASAARCWRGTARCRWWPGLLGVGCWAVAGRALVRWLGTGAAAAVPAGAGAAAGGKRAGHAGMIGRAMTATTFHRHPAAPWVELRESRAAPHCYRLHMHAEYSIGIVDAGAAVFHHAGGPERVEVGSVVLIEPGVWHACNPEDGAPWAYRMLFVQADWLCAQLGVRAPRFARARHDAAAAQTVHRLCQPLDARLVPRRSPRRCCTVCSASPSPRSPRRLHPRAQRWPWPCAACMRGPKPRPACRRWPRPAA